MKLTVSYAYLLHVQSDMNLIYMIIIKNRISAVESTCIRFILDYYLAGLQFVVAAEYLLKQISSLTVFLFFPYSLPRACLSVLLPITLSFYWEQKI